MVQAVDLRFRPPTPSFLNSELYLSFPPGRSVTMEECIRDMEEGGIVGVIMGRQAGQGRWGKIPNDEIAETCRRYPGRFVAFGGLDTAERDPRGAIKELDRCIKGLGFSGINIEPGICARPQFADDASLFPVYARCQELGIPVSISLSGIIGPDISYSNPEGVHRVAKSFPDLKIIVSHGAWPWLHQIVGVAYACPNVYVSPDNWIYTRKPGYDDFVRAANTVCKGRFLFGTAYPGTLYAEKPPSMKQIVQAWRELPFDNIDEVLVGTASKLFKVMA